MKKVAAFLMCLCLLSVLSMTAFAQGVTVSVEVPDPTLTVVAEKATVTIDGVSKDEYTLERQSTPKIKIVADKNRTIVSVKLNGVDVTKNLSNGYLTLEPVYEDMELVVDTAAIASSSNPKTGDDSYILVWSVLLMVSIAGAAVVTAQRKKIY